MYSSPINNKPVMDAPIFLNQATFISSAFVILTKLNGNKRKYTPYINEKIDNTNKLKPYVHGTNKAPIKITRHPNAWLKSFFLYKCLHSQIGHKEKSKDEFNNSGRLQ